MQFGFMLKKGMNDPMFDSFVDLEKAFNRVPREVDWWALRKLGIEKWLVKEVMAMCDNARTVVNKKHENSEEFKVTVHQGLVPSSLLFVAIIRALMCGGMGTDVCR